MNLHSTLGTLETLVREAGQIVRHYHDLPDDITWKGKDDPVTAADKAVNDFLVGRLQEHFPTDGLLAEESRDSEQRLSKARIWCIDPLDGTKEFIARNGEFSIMVGLAVEGVAMLGVVYQPIMDILYSGIRGEGAWMSTQQGRRELHVSSENEPSQLRLVVSRSHRNPIVDTIKAAIGIRQEHISGSVGLKCGLIARNDADLYLHPAPGTKEWDTCAPEAILFGAGGKMSDCWGRPLRYNQVDVHRHRGLVASNGLCHRRIITLLLPVLDSAGIDSETGWRL